ncbi:LysR family transcriptional regulator [uncultured Devosia sp.]|uniref:LysR family transcriptional regulator n=1 Tax=uncultured Devosia sp. TaxID=211434 RepID=UPI0035C95EC1
MTDLEALGTFAAVVRSGSFTAAARQLNVSPAMVGRRIQALEQRHGIKLIERTTRSQRLTELGHEFLARSDAVILAAQALDEITQTGPLSGRVRLSAPATLGTRRLPSAMAQFTAAHPGIVLEMSLSDRRVDLVAEGYDVAVRVGVLPPSSLMARRIGTYRFACCAAPAFLARHGTPRHPSELERARCLLNLNLRPRNRWIFHDADDVPLTVEVGGGIEIDNGEAQRAMAVDGAGIVYLPRDLVAPDLERGALVEILTAWSLPTRPVYAVHPSRHLVPRRVTALIDALADAFRGS